MLPQLRFGLMFVTGLIVFAHSAAAQSRPPLVGFVDDLTLGRYAMTRKWYVQVPTLRIRERILSLKQHDNLLFAASSKGLIHCIEAETGRILWTQTVSESASDVFPPALTKDFVFVTSGTRMTQLDRTTGRIILTKELSSATTSGPGANNEFVYVQTVDNHITAIRLSPDPDEEFKKWPFKRKYTLPYVQWFFDAGSALHNAPIVLKDRVLFTSANGIVFASVLDQRSLYYRYIPGAPIAAPVSFRDKTLYIATVDFNLFAVNAQTGATIWRFASGYPIYRQPVPFADDVYLTPVGGGLFSIDNADGALRWVNEAATRVVAVSQNRVYAMSDTMRFLVLDRKDGAIIGSWPCGDFPVSAFNQTSDRIYLATDKGLIICIAEKANEKPFLHEAPIEDDKPKPSVKPAKTTVKPMDEDSEMEANEAPGEMEDSERPEAPMEDAADKPEADAADKPDEDAADKPDEDMEGKPEEPSEEDPPTNEPAAGEPKPEAENP